MNKEEIEEIETLEIDFKDTDELKLALEVSSKKAIYLIDDLIKHLFELQQQNQKYKEVINKINNCIKTKLEKENEELTKRIDKAIEYIENNSLYETEYDYDYEENSYLSGIDDEIAKKDLLNILKGES